MGFETYQTLVEMLADERDRIDHAFEALRRACGEMVAGSHGADPAAADARQPASLHDRYRMFHSVAIDRFEKEEPYLSAVEEGSANSEAVAGHRHDHHRIAEWLAAVARELEAGAAAADIRPLLELAYLWLADHHKTHDAALVRMLETPP